MLQLMHGHLRERGTEGEREVGEREGERETGGREGERETTNHITLVYPPPPPTHLIAGCQYGQQWSLQSHGMSQ